MQLTMKSFKQRMMILVWLVLLIAQGCILANFSQAPPTEPGPAVEPTSVVVDTATTQPSEVVTATQTPDATAIPDPPEFIDILPIDLGDGQVLLWAGGAMASSSADRDAYHAKQALGKPNTLACGRFVTAWQPAAEETEAWLELYFSPYILPNEIQIIQSYLPKQLSKVELITLDEDTITIFDREVDDLYQPDECPATRGFWLPDVDVLISTVRIMLERDVDEAWTQIDAVGVVGLIGDGPTQPMATADWVEEGDEDFFAPRYYTNKNEINAITFAGDQLWTASDGGVVAWDLDGLNPTPYPADLANVTRAIAYCDWEYGGVITGGVAGIAMLNDEYFLPIEHPGDESLGAVTALACDPQREQIWVGYLGHLSRYNLVSQSWTEFGEGTGMPMDVVRQIKIIGQDVWVATAFGVAVVRGGAQLTAYTPENSAIPTQFVHAIAADKAGVLWMASSSGLIEFDGKDWTLWKSEEINGGPLIDMLMGIDGVGSGILWVADAFGTLCQFDPIMKACLQTVLPPTDEIVLADFKVDPQSQMALGDIKNGVWFVLGDKWFPLRTRDQLLDNTINAIAYAPDGNLWLAGRGGVQYFPANQPASTWQQMPLPDNAQAQALFVAADGLWIGHTQGARFLPYLEEDPIDLTVGDPEGVIDKTVSAITVGPAGLVYLGGYGLSIWDGHGFIYADLLTPEARSKNTYPPRVNVLYGDGDSVWVGASNGLYQYQQGHLVASWHNALLDLTGSTSSVGVITGSPDGSGLLIAVGSKLFQFVNGDFNLVLELPSEIRSVYAMPYALMLGTAHSGLYSLPTDDFGIYWEGVSTGGGFARCFGNQAITMSDRHTLWIASCEGGLQRNQALYSQ